MPTALGLAVWQQRTKPPPESSLSPQTPTSSSSLDTPEHLPPGCPQVPAAVLMKFSAVLGEIRWDREEMQTKAQHRGRKADPALGLGPERGVHTHPQRLGRGRWHLNTADF